MIGNYFIKVLWRPLRHLSLIDCKFAQKAENEDYFDRNTNFNPLFLEV